MTIVKRRYVEFVNLRLREYTRLWHFFYQSALGADAIYGDLLLPINLFSLVEEIWLQMQYTNRPMVESLPPVYTALGVSPLLFSRGGAAVGASVILLWGVSSSSTFYIPPIALRALGGATEN